MPMKPEILLAYIKIDIKSERGLIMKNLSFVLTNSIHTQYVAGLLKVTQFINAAFFMLMIQVLVSGKSLNGAAMAHRADVFFYYGISSLSGRLAIYKKYIVYTMFILLTVNAIHAVSVSGCGLWLDLGRTQNPMTEHTLIKHIASRILHHHQPFT
jgi:hypothetical protein